MISHRVRTRVRPVELHQSGRTHQYRTADNTLVQARSSAARALIPSLGRGQWRPTASSGNLPIRPGFADRHDRGETAREDGHAHRPR